MINMYNKRIYLVICISFLFFKIYGRNILVKLEED